VISILPLMSGIDAALIEIRNVLDIDLIRDKKHFKSFDF